MRCNKCGNAVEQGEKGVSNGFLWNEQFQNINLRFPYHSKHDNQEWKFTLCEECILDIVKTFKYVPQGFHIDSTPTSIETTEQHQIVFDHWKETGAWEDLRFYTYEELKQLAYFYDIDEVNKMIGKYHEGKPFLNLDEENQDE